MYTLKRTRDGAGDSGPLSVNLKYCTISGELEKVYGKPLVGYALQVGSIYARSYTAQDYWQTTYITEILEDTVSDSVDGRALNFVRFKTGNSEYEWVGSIYAD